MIMRSSSHGARCLIAVLALAVAITAASIVLSPVSARQQANYEYRMLTSTDLHLSIPSWGTEVEKINQAYVPDGWELYTVQTYQTGSNCYSGGRDGSTSCQYSSERLYLLRRPRG